jgi:hypothetical protein
LTVFSGTVNEVVRPVSTGTLLAIGYSWEICGAHGYRRDVLLSNTNLADRGLLSRMELAQGLARGT